MGTPLSSQMSYLIDALESIGWLMGVSSLLFLLMRIFLVIGRWGASFGWRA